MKITFLGTGAADWPYHPAPEDINDNQNRIRRLSSALVDDHILIDPAPESYRSAIRLGVDVSKIDIVLQTHSHSDHFNADELRQFVAAAPGLTYHCHTHAVGNCKALDTVDVKMCPLEIMEEFSVGGYTIKALPGNHVYNQNGEIALHYLIHDGKHSIFYGLDSAWFMAEEWEYLMHKKVDCAVLDCTCGDYLGDFRLGTHNSIPMIRLMEPSMRQNEMLAEDGKIVLSHLARTLHKSNAEVEADMKKEGYIVAYDGMTLEIGE